MKKTIIMIITLSLFFLTASAGWSARKSGVEVKKSTGSKHMKIKLGEEEIDVQKIKKKWYFGYKVDEQVKVKKGQYRTDENKMVTKVYSWPNSDYYIRVENQTETIMCQRCDVGSKLTCRLELYLNEDKVFVREFKDRNVLEAVSLRNGLSLFKFEEATEQERYSMMSRKLYEVYNNRGELVHELKDVTRPYPWKLCVAVHVNYPPFRISKQIIAVFRKAIPSIPESFFFPRSPAD